MDPDGADGEEVLVVRQRDDPEHLLAHGVARVAREKGEVEPLLPRDAQALRVDLRPHGLPRRRARLVRPRRQPEGVVGPRDVGAARVHGRAKHRRRPLELVPERLLAAEAPRDGGLVVEREEEVEVGHRLVVPDQVDERRDPRDGVVAVELERAHVFEK